MNRLFDAFFDTPVGASGAPGRRWLPAMDLVESDDRFVLRADLPGVAEDAVKVELEDSVLTVSGERKAEHEQRKEGYHRVERAYGAFSRSLTLPEGVDAEAVEATFERGVLEVRIPKPEQRKPRACRSASVPRSRRSKARRPRRRSRRSRPPSRRPPDDACPDIRFPRGLARRCGPAAR